MANGIPLNVNAGSGRDNLSLSNFGVVGVKNSVSLRDITVSVTNKSVAILFIKG
jgi:hypothetical protein